MSYRVFENSKFGPVERLRVRHDTNGNVYTITTVVVLPEGTMLVKMDDNFARMSGYSSRIQMLKKKGMLSLVKHELWHDERHKAMQIIAPPLDTEVLINQN